MGELYYNRLGYWFNISGVCKFLSAENPKKIYRDQVKLHAEEKNILRIIKSFRQPTKIDFLKRGIRLPEHAIDNAIKKLIEAGEIERGDGIVFVKLNP